MAIDRPRPDVRIEIGIDSINPEVLAPFWVDALGYELGELDSDGTYLELIAPRGSTPVYLQRVPERKSTKNRLHLDLFTTEPDDLVEHLCDIGASRVGDAMINTDGAWWQVMADPEGNEFCVCRVDESS
jgi:predicted enzyme related to lactoylglutathione lyase